ncbi:MAG: phosphohydrolase [Desulfuromonadales bacterium]|nr:phosphohydrolase [Desulfuromonadales bacterium]
MNPEKLIHKYYRKNKLAETILLEHSRMVTSRALKISNFLQSQGIAVDQNFVAEAAMLHGIGIVFTDTPELGCNGNGSYLQHGIRGKEILLQEGLPQHARVCERHIGVGLTATEIRQQNLPLPGHDMLPETIEEQIISYADLFYSKNRDNRNFEKSPDEVRAKLKQYGANKVDIFNQWLAKFEPELY